MKSIVLILTLSFLSQSLFAKEKETLLGVTYDTKSIIFQVKSGGCTTKKNFEVLLSQGESFTVELVRHIEDLCEAAVPNGIKIEYTYEELGLARGTTLHLSNPVQPGAILIYH